MGQELRHRRDWPLRPDVFVHSVLEEGGIVWKGHRTYRTLDAALADAELGCPAG